MEDKNVLWKLSDVAEYLGVDPKTVKSWQVTEPTFPKSKEIGGSVVFNRHEVEQFATLEQTKIVTGDTTTLNNLSRELIKRSLQDNHSRQILFTSLVPEMFTNELYFLYRTMYLRRGRDAGRIDRQYLVILLDRRSDLLFNNPYIDLSIFSDSETDVEVAFMNSVLKTYDQLNTEPFSNQDLTIVREMFLLEYKHLRVAAVLDDASDIIRVGKKQGKVQLKGSTDAMDYIRSNFRVIESETDVTTGRGLVYASEAGLLDDDSTKQLQISDFGDLTFLNNHFGGIFTSNMYSFLAPPKSGKTKLCLRLAYTSITKYQQNVLFWAKEGGSQKAMAELRVMHFMEYYKDSEFTQDTSPISVKDIMRKTLTSEMAELEALSREDLFASGKYGDVIFIEDALELDTFEAVVKDAVVSTGATSIYIDYLALIQSKNNPNKSQVVSLAYQKALSLCKDLKIALISPAQYKQSAIDELVKGNDIDMRTAGGESSEVVRTPDVNLALYATSQMLIERQLKFLSVPSRDYEAFTEQDAYIDFSYNYFSDLDTD